jgi:hypothetical protein
MGLNQVEYDENGNRRSHARTRMGQEWQVDFVMISARPSYKDLNPRVREGWPRAALVDP